MFGDNDGDRRGQSLAGLAMTLLLLVLCLVLVRKIQVRTMLESCEARQQTGCMVQIDKLRVSHILAGF